MTLAYIDPGSGALLLQAIIAGAIGAGVYFRRAIAAIFKRKPENKPENMPEEKSDKK